MSNEWLTQDYLKSTLDYDQESGLFVWRYRPDCSDRFNNKWAGKQAGSRGDKRRIAIFIRKTPFSAHRLAWLYVYGEWPIGDIDHINGNPHDNRISNLRVVDHQGNMQNMRSPKSNNTTGRLGVTFDNRYRKYYARITVGGKRINLGCFDNVDDAGEAYLNAKRELHSTCSI